MTVNTEKLDSMREKNKKETSSFRMRVMLCAGTGCISNKSNEVEQAFIKELNRHGLKNEVQIVRTGCQGFCGRGPLIVVDPERIFYQLLNPDNVAQIVEEHLKNGRPVERLMYSLPGEEHPIPGWGDIPFFKKQKFIALTNRARINPERIDDFIGRDGYQALVKVLKSMTGDQVIEQIEKSGLRGRGGAGFSTGMKWKFAKDAPGNIKYIICNADEGDPGAFMDRAIIESDPHALIEGMLIGGYAIGAAQGFIYLRNEYPLALLRMLKAIEDARAFGLLGDNILNTGLSFDLQVSRGAGAFVCGEETSLINSLEGKLPDPRARPPYPAIAGYRDYPTTINNVETWANIRHIINKGAEWFSGIGTDKSRGTKVFSLVGKVNNQGLVEVPMGLTLRELIFEIGGGIPGGKKFKAVQTGGPSGGCIPAECLDITVDYESLAQVGSIVGSGGMIVLDEDNCMVEIARFFLSFTQSESCGKCTPCREGTRHMLDIITNITEGKGQEGDIELLEKMAYLVKDSSLCALGHTAPNPILTTIRYFRDEYEAHIRDKRCPARECKDLIFYSIDPETCTGCTLCAKNCPAAAITGEKKAVHKIDKIKCIKCGMCRNVCKFKAVKVQS